MSQLSPFWGLAKIFWCEIKIKLSVDEPISLIKFLSCPDWDTRWNAADSLYSYSDKTLITPLFDALQKETNLHVRKRLMWALETNKAWDELYLCLDSSEFDVRSNAADALAHCGESRFVAPLLKRMYENDNQDYIYSMVLKGIVDTSSVRLLFEYLPNATPSLRKGLLELLGATKDKQVFNFLAEALKDPSAEIRKSAAIGLLYLGDTRAIEPLQELLNDPSEDVKREAKAVLYVFERRFLDTTSQKMSS